VKNPASPSNQAPARPGRPGRPLWLYRILLGVGIPLVFLLALEVGLRVAGFGRAATFLIPDAMPGYLRTNPDFASLFLPGNFDLRPLNFRIAARKAPGTVRIVVLGESAAQGVPVPSFAFAPQVRAQLRSRYPGKDFEVINTGIVAINSHVVYQVAREMARYEPDVFLVYTGNNEVVGPYGPGCAYLSQMPPLWVIRASVFVRSTRTGQLLSSLVARLARGARRPAEWGGMSMFVDNAVRGDDPRLTSVYANFAANLRGIVDAANGAGAKTVLCTVVANLKDCPPFLSLHRRGLARDDLTAWQAAFDAGRLAWMLGDADRARTHLAEALKLDPQYADTHFMLGTLELQSGDDGSARQQFVDALFWDALRFRPDAAIDRIIREVAAERPEGVSLLDTADALGSDPASVAPLSGRELLFEHVHFDWDGNYRLARLMARACGTALFGRDPGDEGWLDNEACSRALAYTAHERLPMLLRIDVLTRKPPFTNELTHVADEARMARDIAAARTASKEPESLSESADVATAALGADPDNPALAGILEGIRLDQGDFGAALELARRAEGHLPRDFALAADEASILMRLGRYDDALRILKESARSGADLDMLAPVFSEFWTQTKRFEEGLGYLGGEIQRRPGDIRLRIVRAGLVRASGDAAGAEREFKGVLASDPSSEDALESIVSLLDQSGMHDDAAQESLAAAPSQPRNQANSLRAVRACEALGDDEGALRNLLAAEKSGPVTATFELTLALKLYKLGRPYDMMVHLAEARNLSVHEGNSAVTDSIANLIARMRAETRLEP
jgi:tetratricopeptide (TPR) repeat protein